MQARPQPHICPHWLPQQVCTQALSCRHPGLWCGFNAGHISNTRPNAATSLLHGQALLCLCCTCCAGNGCLCALLHQTTSSRAWQSACMLMAAAGRLASSRECCWTCSAGALPCRSGQGCGSASRSCGLVSDAPDLLTGSFVVVKVFAQLQLGTHTTCLVICYTHSSCSHTVPDRCSHTVPDRTATTMV